MGTVATAKINDVHSNYSFVPPTDAREKEEYNREYLAKIERGIAQMKAGTGTYLTDSELREMIYGH